MKYSIFSLLLILFFLDIQAQNLNLEYSLIRDNYLHVGFIIKKDNGTSEKVKAYNLKRNLPHPKSPNTSFLLNSYFPYAWKLFENHCYVASGYGSFPSRGSISFANYPLVTKDSLQLAKTWAKEEKALIRKFPDEKEREKYKMRQIYDEVMARNTQGVTPAYYLALLYSTIKRFKRKEYLYEITYDFVPLGGRQFLFYVRSPKQLSIWKYNYPEYRLPPDPNHDSDDDWEELITYSADTTGSYKKPTDIGRDLMFASGDKHVYNAIADSAFFDGFLNVIPQGEESFVVNLKWGGIYHIGQSKIEKVGQIDLAQYPKWLLGRRIYIEDQDAQELVFFSKVERIRNDLPFPKIKEILSESEFQAAFKHVVKAR